MVLRSIPDVADVHWIRSVGCADSAVPSLLIEVPHGATETSDFETLAALLRSPLPDGLVDFFHVNTDVGAFELALAAARRYVADSPAAVLIVRSRIPRTFIDCNRRIDPSPAAFRADTMTPGLMPWITHPEDVALLRERHAAYVDLVRDASGALAPDGCVLLLHTYAPRSVAVEVDLDVVANLRLAYQPAVEPTWPMRPEFDVITRDAEGRSHAPVAVVDALRSGLGACGWTVAESDTYPLHPSTLAWDHVMQRPGRALCLEVRRDLLADPFDPFARMWIGPGKVDRVARPLAAALVAWGTADGPDRMPRTQRGAASPRGMRDFVPPGAGEPG